MKMGSNNLVEIRKTAAKRLAGARKTSFPLRLPESMRREARELAQREGLSLNQFIGIAVAEKIVRLERDSATVGNLKN